MSPIKPGVYFYGCWRDTGHYLWLPSGQRMDFLSTPFGYDLDGGVQPAKTPEAYCRGRGIPSIKVVHRDGWIAAGFWDNTVDRRPGSCGVFVMHGSKFLQEILDEAKVQFPTIWARLHGDANAGSE